MNRIHQALLALPLMLAGALAQAAEPRVALVIGNSQYSSGALPNPVNDAKMISDTLSGIGFDVIMRRDADQNAMKRAIQEFGSRLEKAGDNAVGLFFYAGHGVQLNGHNYLIPTTAHIEREGDMDIEAVSADWVMDQMRYAHNRINIVILDACRNNPFKRSLRSLDRGLAVMDAPAGTVIAYSTAPGEVADDGDGRDSPYTTALASAMRQSHEPVEQVFKHVRVSVLDVTKGKQTPWESSSLTGDFYFTTGAKSADNDSKNDTAGKSDVGNKAGAASKPDTGSKSPAAASVAKSTPSNDAAPAAAPAAAAPAAAAPAGTSAAAPMVAAALASLAQAPRSAFDWVSTLPSSINGATHRSLPVTDDVCRHVIGRWKASGMSGEVAVQADQTLAWWRDAADRSPAMVGRWSCTSPQSRRFVFAWSRGADTLTLSRDERALIGVNQNGVQVVDTRLQPVAQLQLPTRPRS
jgi:caspase domain-containing protein